MKHHLSIDEETMGVLKRSVIKDRSLELPAQLDRKLYEKVNKVILIAGGKWNRGAKAHVFQKDPREILGLAIESGAIKDTKKANQEFFTPSFVAKRIAQLGEVSGKFVLEPSAGHGALADAAKDAGAKTIVCVEVSPESCAVLRKKNYYTIEGDFMDEMAPAEASGIERILMNPPFTGSQDIDHVTHAFDMLDPGGRLVAITSPSWQHKQDKKSEAFRGLVDQFGEVKEELPEGTFKESGTNVRTIVLVLQKP